MKKLSGRGLGIVVAVLVVGGLALYVATAGQHGVATPGGAVTLPAATPGPQPGGAVPSISGGSLVGLLLRVGIVAVLLGACLWALRKYAANPNRTGGRTSVVHIVDTISLAQNRALYVLDVGDRAVVVGATPQQFSLIAELTDEAVLARLRTKPERPESSLSGFSRQIGALLQRSSAQATAAPLGSPLSRARAAEAADLPAPPAPRRRAAQPPSFADTLANASVSAATTDADGDTAERLRALTERLGSSGSAQ